MVRVSDMSEQVVEPSGGTSTREKEHHPARSLRWAHAARWPRLTRPDSLAAVITWIVGTPLALLVVHVVDRNPFTVGGAIMPIAVGGVVAGGLLLCRQRLRSDLIIGIVVGAYAAWIALTMGAALHGTPFGYGEMLGDQGRLVAMATKYTSSWAAVDAFVPHLATEYPPLYPWLVGHGASLLNRPAWKLFGEAQILLMSGSIVIGYLLWRRLAGPRTSFVIVAIAPAVYADPSKGYEFVTLLVIIPWVLATFAGLPRERGGMHWLPAGIIGGLLALTYSAFLVFGILGILAMIVVVLRAATKRRDYLLHLLGVIVTAFVVASWYVVPFLVTSLTKGGNRISDLYLAPAIVTTPLPLPFLDPTPLGVVELIGLFGIIWYRRSTWWAQPILLLTLSTFVYQVAFLLNTVHNNHTGYVEYTSRLTSMLLATAGILTVTHAWPSIRPRLSAPLARQREIALVAIVVLVSWAAVQGWEQWTPGPRGLLDVSAGCSPACPPAGAVNLATSAHVEPLPDGKPTRFAPPGLHVRPFPATAVQRVIESTLGPKAHPITLSFDQRLFAYYPDYAYTSPNRLSANTLQRWDDRYTALKGLATFTDPENFAAQSARTAFGRIDVFVLHRQQGAWLWNNIAFSPKSFGHDHFRVQQLSSSVVVAVRFN
jgi:hypothetical protein